MFVSGSRSLIVAVFLAALLIPSAVIPATTLDQALLALNLVRPPRERVVSDFVLALMPSGTLRLSQYRGKIVIINFWATWCDPCRKEMPSLERLWQRYRDSQVTVIAVSVDASSSAVASFAARHRLSLSIGLDPTMEIAGIFGARALPATFVIARDQRLVAMAFGDRAWDSPAAEALIEFLLREDAPSK